MITRRRFTAAAAATLAAGPFIHRAGAQTKTVIRYGDVLPANYPSVVALEAAGKEIADKTGGRLELQTFPGRAEERDAVDACGENAPDVGSETSVVGAAVPAKGRQRRAPHAAERPGQLTQDRTRLCTRHRQRILTLSRMRITVPCI